MWHFKGKEFKSEDIGKAFGFVYLITDKTTGLRYIGQKQFWSKKTVQKDNVKKKVKCESDWKKYYSSSEKLKDGVKAGNEVVREILYLCVSKGQENYLETMLQFKYRVLENQDIWLNGIINIRCTTSHVKMNMLVDADYNRLQELDDLYYRL